jgi:protein TonB
MFDLITGKTEHAPRPHIGPVMVSMAVHAGVIAAVLVGTFWFIAPPTPRAQMMMAFVAAPPPPPPPPPPAPAPPQQAVKAERPVPTSGNVAPVEMPAEILPEAPAAEGMDEDVAGVPGGVPGGIAGGVLGGLMPEAPPPPPEPPAPRKPVRIGGQIKEPALIYRVQPEYPLLAVASKMEGLVILEAIVDEEGRVETVRSLRAATIFDDAALKAVRQWRYSPVLLNGRPEKFILTVVVSFTLTN